ncbi:MAG: DUF3090 family protein [Actinomycetota bacterium]|nr:DUF3090 family protein [Actinomycetota bacterium]MDQ3342305.1 DUF3090 family protein [Actinomycetota bacterium]
MGDSFEIDPVDWVTAGAVGEPGRRTFYLQARRAHDLLALVVEKAQVQWLAQLAQELLSRVGVTVTPDDLDANAQQLLEPVVATWRAGSLSLGMDEEGQRFLLEAEQLLDDDDETQEEPGTIRLWLSRDQLVAMAAYAAFIVEAGARESCRLCGRPVDPVTGHVCPATNGHGPLTA